MSATIVALRFATAIALAIAMGQVQAVGVPGQGSWESTLQARDLDGNLSNGPEAFYDTQLNVTWLSASSSIDMQWEAAKTWAEQVRFGLGGWRLPFTRDTGVPGCDRLDLQSDFGGTDCGFNPDSSVETGSEMAHLFFQSLGNKSTYAPGTMDRQQGSGLTNTGGFLGLQASDYWSGTEYAPDKSAAWVFGTSGGDQVAGSKGGTLYALAVRPGDVPTVAVPEPESLALMLAGLGAFTLLRRRLGFSH